MDSYIKLMVAGYGKGNFAHSGQRKAVMSKIGKKCTKEKNWDEIKDTTSIGVNPYNYA